MCERSERACVRASLTSRRDKNVEALVGRVLGEDRFDFRLGPSGTDCQECVDLLEAREELFFALGASCWRGLGGRGGWSSRL